MATEVRSSGVTTYATRTNTTIPAPAGIEDGDDLWLSFESFISGIQLGVTLPSGFALIDGTDFPHEINPAGGDTMALRIAHKVASGEAGDYTLTHGSMTTQGCILCVSGGDNAVPAYTIQPGGGATVTALSITPVADNSLVIFVGAHYDGITTTTPPAGTTPTFTEYLDGVIMYVAAGVLTPAGATGDKAVTADGAGGANPDDWHASLSVIETAPAGAGAIAHLVTTGGWVF